MKRFINLFSVILIVVLISCSSDPMVEGDKLYSEGQYTKALKKYQEVLQTDNNNSLVREKLALTMFRIGQNIYIKRKVLSSFTSYYEKSLPFIPPSPSSEFNKEYSELLMDLAKAWQKMVPKNNNEKNEQFESVLSYLEEALFYNNENKEAEELLTTFQNDHFEDMLEKGNKYFSRAKKEKNDLHYLNAEYYLKKAHQFNPDHKEAQKLLSAVRKINMDKINPDLDFPMAITGILTKDDYTAVEIYLKNNSAGDLNLSPAQFILTDKQNREFTGETTELFSNPISEQTVKSGGEIQGVLSFKTGGSPLKTLQLLKYESSEGVQTLKYFP